MPEKYAVIRYLIYRAFFDLNKGVPMSPENFELLRAEGIDPLHVNECYDAGMTVEDTYMEMLVTFMGIPTFVEEEEEDVFCAGCPTVDIFGEGVCDLCNNKQ